MADRLNPARLIKRMAKVFAKAASDAPKVQTFHVDLPDMLADKPSRKSAVKRNKARRKKQIRKHDRKAMKRKFHAADKRRRK